MAESTDKRGGRGGRRPGSGRPRTYRRITLSPETGNILRELVRLRVAEAHRADVPEFTYTFTQAVEDLIYTEAARRGALAPETSAHWLAIERGEESATDE